MNKDERIMDNDRDFIRKIEPVVQFNFQNYLSNALSAYNQFELIIKRSVHSVR